MLLTADLAIGEEVEPPSPATAILTSDLALVAARASAVSSSRAWSSLHEVLVEQETSSGLDGLYHERG